MRFCLRLERNSRVTQCVFVRIRTISNNSCTQHGEYIVCLFHKADGFRCNLISDIRSVHISTIRCDYLSCFTV
jgi:hypothetical protein